MLSKRQTVVLALLLVVGLLLALELPYTLGGGSAAWSGTEEPEPAAFGESR